jgi:hypothetical protein
VNVRTHLVPTIPHVSTGAIYVPVSLPCEPWNKPSPREPKVVTVAHRIDRTDPENRIIAAIKAGHTVFDQIVQGAFGNRTGKIDDLCRATLRSLLDRGVLTRVRAMHLPGQPFIWSINREGSP